MRVGFHRNASRRAWILVIFLFVVIGVYFSLRFLPNALKSVPPEFLTARADAAEAASAIVALSNQTAANIGDIAKLDAAHEYREALDRVSAELDRNREARAKAVALSADLGLMAQNIARIRPASAGQAALEAVSSETTLISKLIAYNDLLNQLLGALQRKFEGAGDANGVAKLIQKINDEARAINELNDKFNAGMASFDGA